MTSVPARSVSTHDCTTANTAWVPAHTKPHTTRPHHTLPTGSPALPHHHRTLTIGVAGFSAKVVPTDHRRVLAVAVIVLAQGDWRPHHLQQSLLGPTSSRAHRRC